MIRFTVRMQLSGLRWSKVLFPADLSDDLSTEAPRVGGSLGVVGSRRFTQKFFNDNKNYYYGTDSRAKRC